MGKKLVNKTNGNEATMYEAIKLKRRKDFETDEEFNEYLHTVEKSRNHAKELFEDNIQLARYGQTVICFNWKQVDEVLSCFDNTDDWIIEEVEGNFYIITNPINTQEINRFNKFKEGIKNDEIVELDREKDE